MLDAQQRAPGRRTTGRLDLPHTGVPRDSRPSQIVLEVPAVGGFRGWRGDHRADVVGIISGLEAAHWALSMSLRSDRLVLRPTFACGPLPIMLARLCVT
jgi:hypothetical protein